MLESKNCADVRYVLDSSVRLYSPDVFRKYWHILLFFVVPEDTTDKPAGRKNTPVFLEASTTRSLAKMAFWVVVSISMSLFIGQLR